jgi:predicted anti-sigma-YlaC factor YlaD
LKPAKRICGRYFYCIAGAAVLFSLAACSPRQMIVRSLADELASQGQAAEDDLVLARDASPFYLKLSESVLAQAPDNLKLAEAVAAGFTQYSFAFVAFEAERIEAKDAKAAQKLRERAARLYLRAHRHAMTALEQRSPGFAQALAGTRSADWPRLSDDQVGVVYWAAASWGGFISLSKDNPDVVADLPLAIRLARLAWEQNPDFGNGALLSLMGTFEAARPGGSRLAAADFFDRAIAVSGGKSAGAYVSKAESIALPAGDRAAFDALLHLALDASKGERSLPNAVMSERAQWLLDTSEDRF